MPNPSTRNLLTAFLPLLGVYLLCILPFASAPCERDECDYIESSVQLAAGGAYTAGSSGVLWRGPGYPLVLVPFAWLHLPWAAAKLLNAAFVFAGVLYLYRALRLYVPHRPALLASYAFGLYPPNFRQLPFLLTESLAVFLVCGIIYHFCSFSRNPGRRRHYFVASLFLAYLALTKIFFGYVLLVALLLSLFALCFREGAARVSATICLLALLMCSPYLVLTYSMTGRPFYWGSSGGLSLYWMSTPYAGEYGSWHSIRAAQTNPELARHRAFFSGP